LNEWKTHSKIILAVDYDATISPYHTIDNKEDIARTIALIKECQLVGCYTMIHTNCDEKRYQDILAHCARVGLKVDNINRTPIDLPYGKEGSKPYYNHSLDDRAALPASLDILEDAMWKMRAYKSGQRTGFDI
jgi:hypothetical protein